MASNVINQWLINYKPWVILEAITIAIVYAFTHQGLFACSLSSLSGIELHSFVLENNQQENKTIRI